MHRFRVWAPRARRVDVVLDDDRHQMTPTDDGWFVADTDAAPGDDYAFSLDGGPPRPDPRSPWQPHGVHGPSRLVDHEAFTWTDTAWRGTPLASAVVYELHVGTFTPEGTFAAAIGRLDHLVDLGVTVVELMPVAEFPGDRGWGYDGVALYAPHHAYGGPTGLKHLVDACHARGLGVVMDVVYNHLGPSGNYLREFGPYFTDRYRTPWGEAVSFDGPGSDEVRAFVMDNALTWLRDYHCDGLRLDAVHAIVDASATHLLEELGSRVEAVAAALGRALFVVAESDLNEPRLVRSRDAGGYGLDAQWSDDFHHALHAVLTGERRGYYEDFGALAQLATALERTFVYAGEHSRFRGRRHGRPPAGIPAARFLGYLQNHDQVGNRATGGRMSHLVGVGRLQIGAALVLTAPFVPLLFQGEEWAASTPFLYFTDHQDPDLAQAVRDGRRHEFAAFGWNPDDVPDPQAPDTFARSKLRWDERTSDPHRRLLDWHRALIRLRKTTPEMTTAPTRVGYDETARWLAVTRGPITIACNFSPESRAVPLPSATPPAIVLTSNPHATLEDGAVTLPGESVVIVRAG